MNRIDLCFQSLRQGNRKAFMPFVTAGDPDLDFTDQLVDTLIANGADLLEIGFPYSDPIADGAVIQASYVRALNKGLRIDAIFAHAKGWATRHSWTPFVAMVSYSLIFRRGLAAFLDQARASGFSGLIVPDLPWDEAEALAQAAQERDLKLVHLVTPTTPRSRAAKIANHSTGFLYCVSVTGITGTRDQLPPDLTEQLTWLRKQTPLPLCVGFGISKPEHVKALRDVADGVIVGSAIVRQLENLDQSSRKAVLERVGALAKSLRQALDAPT